MKKLQTILTIAIISIMVVMNFLILWLMIDIKLNLKNDIGNSVNKTIDKTNIPKLVDEDVKSNIGALKIGIMIDESINKKINSLNLKNGEKGEKGDTGSNSISTNTIETKIITNEITKELPVNGVDGKNGLTPIIRCNTIKNRWESSYDNGETYETILDQNNKQVICIGV